MNIFDKIDYWLNLDEDKYRFIKVVSFTLFSIAIIFFLSYNYWNNEKEDRNKYLSLLDTNALAVIDTIIIRKGISQGAEGNVVILQSFEVKYRFKVDNKIFLGHEDFGRNHLFKNIYHYMSNFSKGDSIAIKYHSKKPKYNKLDIK